MVIVLTSNAICQWQWSDNVTKVGGLTLGRDVVDLAISGDYAYCADEYGLSVWDLSEDERPVEIARTPTPGISKAVAIQGEYAYVADLYHGLEVFDISNPEQPIMNGFLELEDLVQSGYSSERYIKILIRDNVLFLSAPYRFWIVSIEDPIHPEIISVSIPPQRQVSDFVLNGDIAYLSQYSRDGLLVLNIENLEAPDLIISIDVQNIDAIAILDSLLYCVGTIITGAYHFTIYNISNPEEPKLIRAYPEIESGNYILLDGNYCYT